jgi:DNA-directed RNA polymerase specialized sigma24 family protein
VNEEDRRAREAKLLRRLVRALSPLERDALTRFYLLEQTPDQIHRDLGIDPGRLRELKSRVRKALLANRRLN